VTNDSPVTFTVSVVKSRSKARALKPARKRIGLDDFKPCFSLNTQKLPKGRYIVRANVPGGTIQQHPFKVT
jgi:hypothetical protein